MQWISVIELCTFTNTWTETHYQGQLHVHKISSFFIFTNLRTVSYEHVPYFRL